jgi:hypothetical protein
MSQLPRWQVGAVRITRVQELEAPGMRFIVPQATLDNLARCLFHKFAASGAAAPL